MDKNRVLTRVLRPKGTSTLVSGDLSGSVVNSSKLISLQTSEVQGDERHVDSVSLHDAVCDALSAGSQKVRLVGPEGSGKTTSLEKVVLDWAKGERLQRFAFVLHFRLKELGGLQERFSLETLMLRHGPVPPESLPAVLQNPGRVLLVVDDLHVCRQSLDADANALCDDPGQAAPLGCLVASLLHGSLLRGASVLVASRQTDDLKLLSGARMEVLGFLRPQRAAYVNQFFTDPAVAHRALVHMEKTLGFYDFCASPRFCWTVCSLYGSLLHAGGELPETASQLCVDVAVHLIRELSLTADGGRELVLALGEMASRCLLAQRWSCTREEIASFGLEKFPDAVAVFLLAHGEQQDQRVFSFPSQLMQEFLLAASYFWSDSPSEGAEEVLERHGGRAKLLDAFLSALSDAVQRRPLEAVLGEPNADRAADFKLWFKSSSEKALEGFGKDRHHRCFRLLHQAQNKSLVKEIVTPTARMGISYGGLSLQESVALNYVVESLGGTEKLNLYLSRNLTEEQVEVLAPAMSLSQEIM